MRGDAGRSHLEQRRVRLGRRRVERGEEGEGRRAEVAEEEEVELADEGGGGGVARGEEVEGGAVGGGREVGEGGRGHHARDDLVDAAQRVREAKLLRAEQHHGLSVELPLQRADAGREREDESDGERARAGAAAAAARGAARAQYGK